MAEDQFQRDSTERRIAGAVTAWLRSQRDAWQGFRDKPGKRFISEQEAALYLLLFRDLQPAALASAADDLKRLSRQLGASRVAELEARIRSNVIGRTRVLARRTAIQIVGNTADQMRGAGKLFKVGGDDLSNKLDSLFGPKRAEGIAITSTTGGKSAGTIGVANTLQSAGIRVAEVWETDPASNVCPICRPLNGTTRRVWGRKFPRGTPAHKNCRCSIRLRVIR